MKTIFFVVLNLGCFISTAHAHIVSKDYCAKESFTDEVSNLKCDSRYIKFNSIGLPASSHLMMEGIEGTNQQFPTVHDYQFKIKRNPIKNSEKVKTDAGPIGVAVNGVPIFDPSTQGKANKTTGKRPHTLLIGELDKCGGHAGRGDDYHYHVAPLCLIEQLGQDFVEVKKKPIGFAMDGYPIHAIGWFDPKNNIENQLDECRGYTDADGTYFYNVMRERNWDILNCFSGKPQKFAKDSWRPRKDKNGNEIIGYPLKFRVKNYSFQKYDRQDCHIIRGILSKEQLLLTSGRTKKIKNKEGSIFYCNPQCYGMFFQADKNSQFKGRVMYYDVADNKCPVELKKENLALFESYKGPPQKYKAPQSTKKK
jgi:hypothetical protein